jgi:hypothetical protein
MSSEEGRTSFLKKRSKKLLLMGAAPVGPARPQHPEVFWFFFSKKNCFFPFPKGQL